MVANVRGEATSKKQQSGVREGGEAWLVYGQDTSRGRLSAYFVLCEGEKKSLDLATGVVFFVTYSKTTILTDMHRLQVLHTFQI